MVGPSATLVLYGNTGKDNPSFHLWGLVLGSNLVGDSSSVLRWELILCVSNCLEVNFTSFEKCSLQVACHAHIPVWVLGSVDSPSHCVGDSGLFGLLGSRALWAL